MKREGEVLIVAALLIISLFFAIPSLALPVDENGNSITNAAVATVDSSGHLEDTSTYIYAETYKGRTDIKTVSLPNAMYIGNSAFQACTELTSVTAPEVVTTGSNVFESCSKIASVNLPKATSIGDSAFRYCTGLVNANLSEATSIGGYAFYQCTNLVDISLPKAASIDYHAFFRCTNLASVSLSKATSIGGYAFSQCTSLANISLPEAASINYDAFHGCSSLASIDLPKATSIGDQAFYSCSSLANVSLPKVVSVGVNAFYRTALTSLACPAATTFSTSAVDECANLMSLRLDSATRIGVLRCPGLKKLAIPSATSFDANAFQYCSALETLVVGGSATSLANNTIPNESKLTVFIPNGVVESVKQNISAGGTLYTNVIGYQGPAVKQYLFFSTAGGSRSCLIAGAEGAHFSWANDNHYGCSVDTNGIVTVSNYGNGTLTVSKEMDIGDFSNLRIQAQCRIATVSVVATASLLTDNSTATMRGSSMTVYPKPNMDNPFRITKSDYPTFTFRSYDDEWWEITYGTNTAYLAKPAISTGSDNPTPNPNPGGGGGGGNSGNNTPPVTVINNTNNNIGKTTDDGIKMTLKINGKETEVLLALNNFTYDYTEPETVTATTRFQIRKGPDGVFGAIRSTKKGEKLTIIGRDGRWLKIDLGKGKIGYILEDMTE